jgi:hypothetical protein
MKTAQSAAFICLGFSNASFAIDIKKQRSAERRSALLCF